MAKDLDRAGRRLLAVNIAALKDLLEAHARDPLRHQLVPTDPRDTEALAHLDDDIAAALRSLDEAKAVLSRYFFQRYAVGDVVNAEFDDGIIRSAEVVRISAAGSDERPLGAVLRRDGRADEFVADFRVRGVVSSSSEA